MNYQHTLTVADGQSELLILPEGLDSLPIALLCAPGSGGTAHVFVTAASHELLASNPSTVNFVDLESSGLTVNTAIQIDIPISAIKLTAAGATATLDIRTFDIRVSVKN